MKILKNIYETILLQSPSVPPETGGILGGNKKIITTSYFDTTAICGSGFYSPNTTVLNNCIKQWSEFGIEFYGMFHTHSLNWDTLSNVDKEYIHIIMSAMPSNVEYLYFPLVFPNTSMKAYKAVRNSSSIEIVSTSLTIIGKEELL